MKTKEEIDELYHKCWDDFSNKYDDNLHYYSFVEGYTQCQDDMADKKYTEEDLRNAYRWGTTVQVGTSNHFEDFIKSLNKQD
jgi:hypothetical protein